MKYAKSVGSGWGRNVFPVMAILTTVRRIRKLSENCHTPYSPSGLTECVGRVFGLAEAIFYFPPQIRDISYVTTLVGDPEMDKNVSLISLIFGGNGCLD